ncbi:MAG: hypothetical protein KGN16_01115 [Burkholderiales bacterium]|nr:hypothetical protein [Burkholderiales bacterium]
MRRLIAAVLLATAASAAEAQSAFSAKDLVELDETQAAMFVMGWLAGYESGQLVSAADSADPTARKVRVCTPPGTTGKIAYAVVQARYFELRGRLVAPGGTAWDRSSWLPAGMFVQGALAAYWPCPD